MIKRIVMFTIGFATGFIAGQALPKPITLENLQDYFMMIKKRIK